MVIRRRRAGIGMLVCACIAAGCASSSSAPERPPVHFVTADAFADAAVVREGAPPTRVPIAERPAWGADGEVVTIAGDAPVQQMIASPGAPAGDTLVVDQMVGQINGKPIYAEEFFRDMDARLRELAKQMTLRQWIKEVRADVDRKLWDVARDELLLAEFRSTLTPEMKVGVLAFIESVRSDLLSGNLGSEELANERALEEEGLTLREKVKADTERQFVLQQLRKSIANRVYVSSRDIELYYEQNYEKYNPVPDAVFRVIRVSEADGGTVASVESRLAGGESFAAVAADDSGWAPDKGNEHRVTIKAPTYAEQDFWALPELNKATKALSPGQVTPKITERGAVWWVMLEKIEHPPGKSLYDVQLEIERELRAQRLRVEELRYFETLLAKSNMSDMEDMTVRLVEYAAVRYYVQPQLPSGE